MRGGEGGLPPPPPPAGETAGRVAPLRHAHVAPRISDGSPLLWCQKALPAAEALRRGGGSKPEIHRKPGGKITSSCTGNGEKLNFQSRKKHCSFLTALKVSLSLSLSKRFQRLETFFALTRGDRELHPRRAGACGGDRSLLSGGRPAGVTPSRAGPRPHERLLEKELSVFGRPSGQDGLGAWKAHHQRFRSPRSPNTGCFVHPAASQRLLSTFHASLGV